MYSQPAKYNRFQNTMEGFKKNPSGEKTWCRCEGHATQMYDPALYRGCYQCKKAEYRCCARREFQV
jgi:hypothetical protein